MAITYNSKMEDSLITKIQLFLFSKTFEEDFNINDYLKEDNKCTLLKNFKEFKITANLVNLYSSQYFQQNLKSCITYNNITKEIQNIVSSLILDKQYMLSKTNIKKLGIIYEELKEQYRTDFQENIFPKTDFDNLIKVEKCSYCGISIKQIDELGKNGKLHNKRSDTRGYSLEIDRKLPNFEYSKENCCMACYWCNNAKTDEFSPKEFKPIAKAINIMWNKRFKSLHNYKRVVFPEKSTIWNKK